MRNTIIAASIALLPTFAEAQGCSELADIQESWQDANINTHLMFRGRGDDGMLR